MSTKDFRNSIRTLSKSSSEYESLIGGTNVCSSAEARSAIADCNENDISGTQVKYLASKLPYVTEVIPYTK